MELNIPAEDRIWLLCHDGVLSDDILHEFACRCAESALLAERNAGREPHPDSWRAIEMKRRWLRGDATDAELSAVNTAARLAQIAVLRGLVQNE